MQNKPNPEPKPELPKPDAIKAERGIRDEKFDEQNEGFLIGAAKEAAKAAGVAPEQWDKWAAKIHHGADPRVLKNLLDDPGARRMPSKMPGARGLPLGPQHDLIEGRIGGIANGAQMLGQQDIQNAIPPDEKPQFDRRIPELDKMPEKMAEDALKRGRDAVGMPVPKLAPQDAAFNKGRDAIKAAQAGPNAAKFNDDMIRAVETWSNGIYRGGNRDPLQMKTARELHAVYRSLRMHQQRANDPNLPQQQREAANAKVTELRGAANAYLRHITNSFIVKPGYLQLNQEGRLVQPNPAGGLEYLPEGDANIEQQQREALQMPVAAPKAPEAKAAPAQPVPRRVGELPIIDPAEPTAVLTDLAKGLDNFNRLEAAGTLRIERNEVGVPIVSLKVPGGAGQFMQIPLDRLVEKNPALAGLEKRIGAGKIKPPDAPPLLDGGGIRNRLQLSRVRYQAPAGFEVKPNGKDNPGAAEANAWQQREPTEAESAFRKWAQVDRARQQARTSPLGFPDVQIPGKTPAQRAPLPGSRASQDPYSAARDQFGRLGGDLTPKRPTPLLPGDPRTERLGPGYREAFDESRQMGQLERGAARDRAREILAQPPVDPKDPSPDKMSDREWAAASDARSGPGQAPFTKDERDAALKKLTRIRARQKAEGQLRGQPKGIPGAAPQPAAAQPNLFPAQKPQGNPPEQVPQAKPVAQETPEERIANDREAAFRDLEKSIRAGVHQIVLGEDGKAYITKRGVPELREPLEGLGWTPPADLMPKPVAPIRQSRAARPARYSQEGIQAVARQASGGNVSAGSMAVMQRFLQNLQEHDPEGLQKVVASNKLPERGEHYKWLDSLGAPTVQYIKHLAGVRTMNGGDANPKAGKLGALAKKILTDPAGYRSNLRALHHALLEANQYGAGSRPVWPDRERMLEVAGKLNASGRAGELDQYLQSVSKGVPLVDIDESPVPQEKKDDKPCCKGCEGGGDCDSSAPQQHANGMSASAGFQEQVARLAKNGGLGMAPNARQIDPKPRTANPLTDISIDAGRFMPGWEGRRARDELALTRDVNQGQDVHRQAFESIDKALDERARALHEEKYRGMPNAPAFVPGTPSTHMNLSDYNKAADQQTKLNAYMKGLPEPQGNKNDRQSFFTPAPGDQTIPRQPPAPKQHSNGVPVSAGLQEQVARLAKNSGLGMPSAKVEDKRPDPATQPKPIEPRWANRFTPGWQEKNEAEWAGEVARAHKSKPSDGGMKEASAHAEVFNQLDDEDFDRAVADYRSKYGNPDLGPSLGNHKKDRPKFVKPEQQVTHMGMDEYQRRMDDLLVKRHPLLKLVVGERLDENNRPVDSGLLPSSGDSQSYEATRGRPEQQMVPRGPERIWFDPKKDVRQRIIDELNKGLK